MAASRVCMDQGEDIKVEYKREEALRVEKNRDRPVCVKKEER